ncbi:AAA-ATPase At3g50940 [Olea europaea subsp. europaea]|uniref:AAA-ATPase At3g50940 n=1 Tax=Olea europaea subsp. europaea TaxID=158383 RepID=A0A8S0R6J8_OLEEU|nr:AAA-ATPase At3g50940 [Olea europaea subsp. europaea]
MASNIFSAYASVAASMMLFRTMAHDIIPKPVKSYIISVFTRIFCYFFTPLSTRITMVVDEKNGMTRNQIYDSADVYLNTKISPNTERFKLTLSGLLNFMDGLWSNCGDERIIIFTTNHKEKIDPALLRPGRMDMHIHMSYCTPAGFHVLASNYLAIEDHPRLFPEIERLMLEVQVTPAEIAEHLLRNENAELALEGVIDLLKRKKSEADEEKVNEKSLETNAVVEVQEEVKKAAKVEKIIESEERAMKVDDDENFMNKC